MHRRSETTGWTLREVGKKDVSALAGFLEQHAAVMPRTMLRYAIEKFPPDQRRAYLQKKTNGSEGAVDARWRRLFPRRRSHLDGRAHRPCS